MVDRPRPEDVNVEDYEPVERRVGSTVFSLRLSPDELGAIATEASREGVRVGTLIKALVAEGLKTRAHRRARGAISIETTGVHVTYTLRENAIAASSSVIEPERDASFAAAAG